MTIGRIIGRKTVLSALREIGQHSNEGKLMANGVHLFSPKNGRSVATIEKNGTQKIVETVNLGCGGGTINGKWQEITEPNGDVITLWRNPRGRKDHYGFDQHGWRRESADGTVETFRYGGDSKLNCKYVSLENPFDMEVPADRGSLYEYLFHDNTGRSLVATMRESSGYGLNINASNIELPNGIKLDGVYSSSLLPEGMNRLMWQDVKETVTNFLKQCAGNPFKKSMA